MRGSLIKARTKRVLPKGQHTWRIILSLGRGADGKYKQKWVTFCGSKKQAEQKLRDLTSEVHHGEFVEPSKVTLGQWLDEWLEKAIRARRAENTYHSYLLIVNKHLKPGLGHLALQGMTPLHVERYYADLKMSSTTASGHRAVLTCALNAAVNAGLVRKNVAQRATNKPRVVSKDIFNNVWTADEARRFVAHLKVCGNTQYAALLALALDSGCRRNELLGLQWRDLEDRVLRVERQLARGGKFSLPKGHKARQFDLDDETLTLLAKHKREQAELKMANRTWYEDNGLMFAQTLRAANTSLGAPLPWSSVNVRLDALCKAAGVRRITLHGLRHTCATLMLSTGVPPHVVQRRLGHSKVELTLNIYAHVLPDMQADAAKRLGALLHR